MTTISMICLAPVLHCRSHALRLEALQEIRAKAEEAVDEVIKAEMEQKEATEGVVGSRSF